VQPLLVKLNNDLQYVVVLKTTPDRTRGQ